MQQFSSSPLLWCCNDDVDDDDDDDDEDDDDDDDNDVDVDDDDDDDDDDGHGERKHIYNCCYTLHYIGSVT